MSVKADISFLTLEMSAFKLFTVVNLQYELSW